VLIRLLCDKILSINMLREERFILADGVRDVSAWSLGSVTSGRQSIMVGPYGGEK
jgi:hypothetical protein